MKADMDEGEFVQRVQGEAQLDDAERARAAVEATLWTLGEHLTAGEAADVDVLLPEGVQGFLTGSADETPDDVSLDAFYRRVGERAGVDPDVATTQARAVMAALVEAVGENELQDVREQLPNEYDSLFEPPEPEG